VATPQLLRAFGIAPSTIEASTEVLTVRPGLAGMSDMQLVYGDAFGSKGLAPAGPAPTPSRARSRHAWTIRRCSR